MAVRIIVDSASDFRREDAENKNIEILPLKVFFGEEEYEDGVTITHDEFFTRLIESDVLPTTSQLTPYSFQKKFREVQEAGDTAVVITLSSRLSGCYQSACLAAEDYEDCIYVVDSLNACVGEQILAVYAWELREQRMTAAQIARQLEARKKDIVLVALIDTLEYLKKGGRISAAAAAAGSLLSIKPVIALINGEVAMIGKARGSKAANNKLKECIDNAGGVNFDMPYCLAYSGISRHMLDKYIEDSRAIYQDHISDMPVCSIGSVIGTHVGPGAIGVAFFGRNGDGGTILR